MHDFKTLGRKAAENGWHVIPIIPNGKAPGYIDQAGETTHLTGWDAYCVTPADDDTLDIWESTTAGVGVACGVVVAVDLDILTSPAEAARLENEVLRIVGVDEAPVRTGRFPKRALIFRAAEPIASRSRKYTADRKGDGIDILAAGRQFVAFGVHPDTKQVYTWRNGSPDTIEIGDLPAITQAMCDAILDLQPSFATTQPPSQAGRVAVPASTTRQSEAAIDLSSVEWLVGQLPNEGLSWDDWVTTGFAIYEACKADLSIGNRLFHEWSMKDARYDAAKTDRKWTSIMRDSRGTVGIGTLISKARACGIQIPSHIQFDETGGLPEVDLLNYADSLSGLQVVVDAEPGTAFVTPEDYAIWLYAIYSGPEPAEGLAAKLNARCPGTPPPANLTADEIEAARQRIAAACQRAATEDIESIVLMHVTPEEHRARFAEWSGEVDGEASDNVVSVMYYNDKSMGVRMSPMSKPEPPDDARWAPPGIIAEFAAWCGRTAPMEIREFAVMAGAALVATLVGRAVQTATGGRPNVYMLNVARSSTGKNHALSCIRKSLAEIGVLQNHILGSNVTSSAAIRNAFERASGAPDAATNAEAQQPDGTSMSKLLMSDEFGSFWASNSTANKGNTHSTSLMGDLLSMFSGAGEMFIGTGMADRSAPVLPYPHLTIFGCSSQSGLFENMSQEQLSQGHVNRFILMECKAVNFRGITEKMDYWTGGKQQKGVPPALTAMVYALNRWCNSKAGPTGNIWTDYAVEVPFTADAANFMAHVDLLKDRCIQHAEATPGVVYEPFGRIAEMTARLALLSAMSRFTSRLADDGVGNAVIVGDPVIDMTDAQWAFSIVKYSAERFAHMMQKKIERQTKKVGETPDLRVVNALDEYEHGAPERDIIRRLHLKRNEMDAALSALLERRAVAHYSRMVRGKPKRFLISSENLRRLFERGEAPTDVFDVSWQAAPA